MILDKICRTDESSYIGFDILQLLILCLFKAYDKTHTFRNRILEKKLMCEGERNRVNGSKLWSCVEKKLK
jgi:hypothetical protein